MNEFHKPVDKEKQHSLFDMPLKSIIFNNP